MTDAEGIEAALSLWLMTRKGATYDEHRGFLVAAENEAAARAVVDARAGGVTDEQVEAAEARGDYSVHWRPASWSWDRSEVECIGTAGPMVPRGILLEDYIAG